MENSHNDFFKINLRILVEQDDYFDARNRELLCTILETSVVSMEDSESTHIYIVTIFPIILSQLVYVLDRESGKLIFRHLSIQHCPPPIPLSRQW